MPRNRTVVKVVRNLKPRPRDQLTPHCAQTIHLFGHQGTLVYDSPVYLTFLLSHIDLACYCNFAVESKSALRNQFRLSRTIFLSRPPIIILWTRTAATAAAAAAAPILRLNLAALARVARVTTQTSVATFWAAAAAETASKRIFFLCPPIVRVGANLRAERRGKDWKELVLRMGKRESPKSD